VSGERDYRVRPRMHLDLVQGGWVWISDILDGKRLIGVKTVQRLTRTSPERTTYALMYWPPGGGDFELSGEFTTAEQFKVAYEATL